MFNINKYMFKKMLTTKPYLSLFSNLSLKPYHENVIDHYEKPRNVGSLDAKDALVGTGLVGAPACGDVMKLQIKVNPETNTIEEAKFKVIRREGTDLDWDYVGFDVL